MKKMIYAVIGGLLAASLAFSAVPTTPTIYGPMDWEIYMNPGKTAAGCQAGAWVRTTVMRIPTTADSTLFTKMPIERGWSYMISVLDSVVTDSVRVICKVYGSDGSTLMRTYDIDTIGAGSTYELISIPVGLTMYGSSVTITCTGIGSTTKKITRAEVWRRRASTKALW